MSIVIEIFKKTGIKIKYAFGKTLAWLSKNDMYGLLTGLFVIMAIISLSSIFTFALSATIGITLIAIGAIGAITSYFLNIIKDHVGKFGDILSMEANNELIKINTDAKNKQEIDKKYDVIEGKKHTEQILQNNIYKIIAERKNETETSLGETKTSTKECRDLLDNLEIAIEKLQGEKLSHQAK